MSRRMRVAALAFVLSLTPACAAVHNANPLAPAETTDQRAYALVSAYALVLEQAAALARDPATPRAVKNALVQAESAATPAVELVKIAALGSREASGAGDALAREQALLNAVDAAAGPVAALSKLVRRR
jgi:hypothetical protein